MAPASNGPFESLGWIELFTAFTRAALLVRSRLTQYGRNVSGLKSFLEAGDIEGVTLPTIRDAIFEEVSGAKVKPSSLGPITPEREAIFLKKLLQDNGKDQKAEKFVSLPVS
jgi:hypothetical protein